MKKVVFFISVIFLATAFIWLIFSAEKSYFRETPGKISVITTLFPLYDFAKIIGGVRANAILLLPPGVEAHSFEPTPEDIIKINQADFFIYTGDLMEPWAKDVINGANNKNLSVINASSDLDVVNGDPHVWTDFSNSQKIADDIAAAFAKKDPAGSSTYFAAADNLKKQLLELDAEFRVGLSNCRTNTFVHGGHYAFGYLARRYSLNYLAAQDFMPDSEPTAKDLAALVAQIKEKNIKYVFYEEMTSPKIAETIASETGAKLLLLNAGHNVTKQDLNRGVSFIDIMKEDLVNLKIGLECR